jgi:uncharacterized SAM-binding protein YcdF (DUF218 family)
MKPWCPFMTINSAPPPPVAAPARQVKRRRARGFPWGWLVAGGFLLSPFGWFLFREAQNQVTQPEAIFVLGGETQRERFAAKFAANHPSLPVWVSGGAPREYARRVFANKNVNLDRLHLDYRAIDTLSNFTTMAADLQKAGIKSVYLITSDDHMARSRLIGEIVFVSHGIIVKPVSFVSSRPDESLDKVVRDGGRAIFWLFTGRSGSTWVKEYKRLK